MKRKLAVVLALVLMFASLIQTIAQVGSQGFSDMPENWSTEALTQAVDNGLLLGHDGKLNPDNNLSRAEMAVVINRAFGATERADISGYTDVKSIDWFYAEMSKAVGMRTFQGYANQLRPNDPINREEVFVVLAKALKLEAEDSIKIFTDINEISEWAKPSVFALINEGYINGMGGKINPKAHITRAEFAQVMHNIIKDYVNTSEVYEKVSEGNVVVNVPNATLKNVVIKGDLIIADGVGEGEVTLENVKVEGRVLVRGGGENSIIIKGDSEIDTIIIVKNGNKVRIFNETGVEIAVATVEGEADVILEGKFKNVVVQSPDITVLARDTEIDKVEVNGTRSTVIVDESSKIQEVIIRANRVTIEGEGEVKEAGVEAGGSGTSITTPQTQINVDRGADDVTGTGGVEIEANETYLNGKDANEDAKPLAQSSTDESSSGSGGTTISPVTKYSVNYSVVGENGTLTSSVTTGSSVKTGTSVTFTATPSTGYEIKEWLVNGTVTEVSGSTLTRTISTNTTVILEFVPINNAPVAVDDNATVDEDSSVLINVLANDSDVDEDTLSITSFTQGQYGSVTQEGNSLRYEPNAEFREIDSFEYEINDGNGETDTATVNIIVHITSSLQNLYSGNYSEVSGAVDFPFTIITEGVYVFETSQYIEPCDTIMYLYDSNNNTIAMNDNYIDSYATIVKKLSPGDYRLSVEEKNLQTLNTTLTIYLKSATATVNNSPVAVNDSAIVNEDGTVLVDVLTNDSDVDGDTISITGFTQGTNGTVVQEGDNLRYTPDSNYNGADTFTYDISDGNGGIATATVNITVNPVNDVPVAIDDSVTVNEDSTVLIDVLVNDTDIDGDTLSITGFTQGTNGTVAQEGDSLRYTPNANYNGSDSFMYEISDGNGGIAVATVNITVNPI